MQLKSLDTLIFTSHQISHFNLHYIGKKASLVLHSDRDSNAWVRDWNGWGDNIFMTTVFCGKEYSQSAGEESSADLENSDQEMSEWEEESQMDCSSD